MKYRTDFVTNSSSSSFIAVKVETKIDEFELKLISEGEGWAGVINTIGKNTLEKVNTKDDIINFLQKAVNECNNVSEGRDYEFIIFDDNKKSALNGIEEGTITSITVTTGGEVDGFESKVVENYDFIAKKYTETYGDNESNDDDEWDLDEDSSEVEELDKNNEWDELYSKEEFENDYDASLYTIIETEEKNIVIHSKTLNKKWPELKHRFGREKLADLTTVKDVENLLMNYMIEYSFNDERTKFNDIFQIHRDEPILSISFIVDRYDGYGDVQSSGAEAYFCLDNTYISSKDDEDAEQFKSKIGYNKFKENRYCRPHKRMQYDLLVISEDCQTYNMDSIQQIIEESLLVNTTYNEYWDANWESISRDDNGKYFTIQYDNDKKKDKYWVKHFENLSEENDQIVPVRIGNNHIVYKDYEESFLFPHVIEILGPLNKQKIENLNVYGYIYQGKEKKWKAYEKTNANQDIISKVLKEYMHMNYFVIHIIDEQLEDDFDEHFELND